MRTRDIRFLDMWNDKQEADGPEATRETCDLNDSPQEVSALLSSSSNPTPCEYASSESTMAGPSHETPHRLAGMITCSIKIKILY